MEIGCNLYVKQVIYKGLYVTCFFITEYNETRHKIKMQYRVGKNDLMCYISGVNENNNKFFDRKTR